MLRFAYTQNFIATRWLHKYLLFVFAFGIYANTALNDYNIDDDLVSKGNLMVQKGINGIGEIFSSPYDLTENRKTEYRPFTPAVFALEYELFGFNPALSHLINAVLYGILCIVLLHFFLIAIGAGQHHYLIAFSAALLFAVHPLHTEVVASLKNRENIFSFLWALLAVIYLMKYLKTKKNIWLFAGLLLIILGLLSKKDSMAMFPVAAVLLYYKTNKLKPMFFLIAAGLLIYSLFGLFKQATLSLNPLTYQYFENPLFFNTSFFDKLSGAAVTAWWYLKLLIYPKTLLFYYGYNMVPVVNPPISVLLPSICIHLAMGFSTLWGVYKKHILGLGGVIYFTGIGVFLQLIEPVTGIVAERHAFIGSAGFCFIIAAFLVVLLQLIKPLAQHPERLVIFSMVVVGAVTAIYTPLVLERNKDWKNPNTLFDADMPHLRNSAMANWMYGNNLMARANEVNISDTLGHNEAVLRAALAYGRATEIYPKYAYAWYNLGMAFQQVDSGFLAFRFFQKVLEVDSVFRSANFFVGNYLLLAQDTSAAIRHFELECSVNINHQEAFLQLVEVYKSKGMAQRSFDFGRWLLTKDPQIPAPYFFVASMYQLKDEFQIARALQAKGQALATKPIQEFYY